LGSAGVSAYIIIIYTRSEKIGIKVAYNLVDNTTGFAKTAEIRQKPLFYGEFQGDDAELTAVVRAKRSAIIAFVKMPNFDTVTSTHEKPDACPDRTDLGTLAI
jgi:hypothetical protein